MLQAGRSRVRFSMSSLDISINLILLMQTQPLTQIITRNLPGVKGGQTERKPDNLTVVCESIFYKMREPRRLTKLFASTACNRDSFNLYHERVVRKKINYLQHVL
jgi:hypothetical protein